MASELIKIEKLNGKNFQSWKYNIKLVLMEKGLFSIADGSEKKPDGTDAKALTAWKLRSDKAYSLIALSIEPSLQIHISATSSPTEAWGILQKHFEIVSISHIVRLTRRYYAAKMGEEEDLLSFITKMISIAQELRELNEEISDKKFAIVILGCLPDSFDNFLTSFNSKPADDLTWDYVKNLLTKEYFKRKDRIETRTNEAHHFLSEDALYTPKDEVKEVEACRCSEVLVVVDVVYLSIILMMMRQCTLIVLVEEGVVTVGVLEAEVVEIVAIHMRVN